MFVAHLSGRDLRSFKKLAVDFTLPDPKQPLSNITLLLGDNGSGKTSLMRALALACCAEPMRAGGFRSHCNVRRTTAPNKPRDARVVATIEGHADQGERPGRFDLVATLELVGDSELVQASGRTMKKGDWSAYREAVHVGDSPGWFFVAYHASRRSAPGDTFSNSARSKARSERYERVASLFEEHVDLVPLSRWLPDSDRAVEARELLDHLLPGEVRVLSELERGDLLLEVEGVALPFSALSDGYRAFLAWAGDLLYRLTIACPKSLPLNRLAGVVLVDEVDLHLHPAWQREVLHRLGAAFPRLQIIATTHSPLVLGSVRHEQVRVLRSECGISKILQPPEGTWGRSADQLLASRFFGLKHTRDQAFVTELERA